MRGQVKLRFDGFTDSAPTLGIDYNSPVTTLRAALAVALLLAPQAHAWTPGSQQQIAEEAARLAPPDLYRQLVRNRASYLMGVQAGFDDKVAAHHVKNPDGGGRLDEVIAVAVDNAIAAIEAPRPFNEVCYRLGLVAHYLADANNPLNTADGDAHEGRYYGDYLAYLESAGGRVKVVFYGFRPGFSGRRNLDGLLAETLERGRGLYPMIGREYRRVQFVPARRSFDDRSTAYAVAALAHSHAVSDIAEVLRYIWLEAGGVDSRRRIPLRGQEVIHLTRGSAAP